MLNRRATAWGLCVLATGAPVLVAARPLARDGEDVSGLKPGQWIETTLDGMPVCIRRRTGAEIAAARQADSVALRDAEPDAARTCRPDIVVVELVCPHGGCRPITGLGPHGGWLCPCHGSSFDVSGRVRRGPAKSNLRARLYRLEAGRLWVLPASTGSCP